ncbi:ribose transport system permease protein [Arthrobacter sp. 1088]|uniref:ABC transporter permease n=1 Tax=Arthrobacter sp. 1088 TaxID=2817768 RepID=UPI0028677C2F|nr:ABC transporter permease [Arthrobacter sp. 1088]MDR6688676.1 ribose transport system permease protein [Arthrobacter sp. 1088]
MTTMQDTIVTSVPEKRPLLTPGLARPLVLLVISIAVLVGGRIFSDGLPSFSAGEAILTQSLFVAVLAFGQGLVMLIGGLDLSIPGVVALSATILALWTSVLGHDVFTGILLALGASVVVGLIDGYLIARFQIPAFIVTLAMGGILTGTTIGVTFGSKSPAAPEAIISLFSGSGKLFGIGLPVVIFIIVGVIGYFIQARSNWGRTVQLFGSAPAAARISGLPVRRVEISVYVVGALASGVAGIMLLGFSGNAQLSLGDEWMMPAIAAVLVGGTVIGSGRGFWQATFMSCILLTTITVVIQATGFSQGWKNVLYGAVVLLALLLMRRGNHPLWKRIKSRFSPERA